MFKYSLIISVRFYEPTNIASTYSDKSLRAYIECQRRLNENSLKIYLSSVLNSGDVRRNEHTCSFKAKRFLEYWRIGTLLGFGLNRLSFPIGIQTDYLLSSMRYNKSI